MIFDDSRNTIDRVAVVKELRDEEWKIIHGDASYGISEMGKGCGNVYNIARKSLGMLAGYNNIF